MSDPLEALCLIEDPAQRAREAGETMREVHILLRRLSAMRREAVLEMRETMTTREVAVLIGVSQPRVTQIEHPGGAWDKPPS